jgi:eukaryotic-like serine/threonine-protein kinase
MTPEHYQRLGQLFDEALALPPDQRALWLEQTCGSDRGLRGEVESLLASQEESAKFLTSPALDVAAKLLSRTQQPSLLGQQFSHYQVLSLLGVGGMGEVYLAEDLQLKRRVALKVLAPELRNNNEQVQRLEQEARAASALNHPNILTIYEIAEADDVRFIAAEYVGGETLRQCLMRKRFTISKTLDIALQIVAALDAAHQAGIVHRDVKPENVILRKDGLVKLLDFGIAKLAPRPMQGFEPETPTQMFLQTNPGMLLGTVAYMSPEQVRGQTVDGRADEWSLGVMLYEMLTGHSPFAGETVNDAIAAILKTEVKPLTQCNSDIPDELERIVLKTLRKDADDRYQNIKALLIDLRDLKEDLDFGVKLQRTLSHDKPTVTLVERGLTTEQISSSGRTPTSATISTAEYLVDEIKRHRRGVLLGLALLFTLLMGAGFLVYARYFHTPVAVAIDSIAVVPFANQNRDPAIDYLQDGLTDSITNSLSRLTQLRVMSLNTMFRYKGREVDPQVVGRELDVRAVLTGRIFQQDDHLIVSAELVNVADGAQLWGEQYSRRTADLVTLQHDIAREISTHLQLRLSGEQQRQLSKGGTNNNEAYQLYLRGRYSWNKRTADGISRAIVEFQQAIEKDPNYALAYVGLADCYLLQGTYAGTPTTDVMPLAEMALQRSLQLDDSIAEAHATKGFVHLYSLQWDEAQKEFQQAITLNPNYATAHHWYAEYFRITRQFAEQAKEIKRAQELDPLSPSMGANLGRAYLNLGDTEAAIKECQRALELNPNFPLAHHFMGLAYVEQHRYDEAIAEFQQAVNSSKRADLFVAGLGIGYATSGRRAEALKVVRELEAKYAKKEATGFDLALVNAALANDDETIAWLEKDFARRNMSGLIYVASTIIHERLHNDPRYQHLLRRMHLAV